MLTRKQQRLLLYINSRLAQDGISPSFNEMKDAIGIKSKSGVHRLLASLEERKFVRRLRYRARAIEILKLPPLGDDDADAAGHAPGSGANDNMMALPLHGRIAAGTPIEALRETNRNVDVPVGMIGTGKCYALEIEGDSMVDAGILDGDTVVVEYGETAENGSIVVALIDDQEATLKRLRRKGGSIALEPANPAYETRIFGPERVKIQGRVVGLMRSY